MPTLSIQRPTFGATLTEQSDGTTTLAVTDFVANDWTETYESMAEALMRLAVLDVAVRGDQTFTEDEAAFAEAARSFILERIS